MTDPDRPFRRTLPGQAPSGHGTDMDVNEDLTVPPPTEAEPLILDPAFHQSVWKPWDSVNPAELEPQSAPAAIITKRRVPLKATFLVVAAIALVVVVALLIPPLLYTPTWTPTPLVEDMTSTPTIAWSADAADPCPAELDVDHAVMTDAERVWSLDLRNGRTRWSLNFPDDRFEVTCLPGAHMVAITVADTVGVEALRTLLIDGATGRTVTEFPGDETAQVVSLGKNIGLVDRSNMLRAFAPGKLDDPLWVRRLPGPAENLDSIGVRDVDATSVQLFYTSGKNVDRGAQSYMPVISLKDGKSPPWAETAWSNTRMYQRVGDVVLLYSVVEDSLEVAVLDLDGRELWSFGDAVPVVSGSRLYAISTSALDDGTDVLAGIREVDPTSGETIVDGVFTGESEDVVPAPDGRLAVFKTGSLTILDEQLQPLPPVQGVDYGGTFLGKKLLYTGGNMYQESNSRRTRLTAVDPTTARVAWVFHVDPGQRIAQMGRHLVVLDNGGKTIHGLRAGSANG